MQAINQKKSPKAQKPWSFFLMAPTQNMPRRGGISQSLKTSQAHYGNYLSIAIKAGESTNDRKKMPLAPFRSRSIFIPPASITLDPPTFFNSPVQLTASVGCVLRTFFLV
jgi:hypothetical protein